MKHLFYILLLTFLPLSLRGQETIRGVCGLYGDNVLWDLKGDTLLISGRGDMANYEWQKPLLSAPWTAYSERIKCVVIKDSVTSVGDYAFQYCKSLTSVTFSNSLKTIGNGAFWECVNLDSITIPNGVFVGDNAFNRCSSLRYVKLPENVSSMGKTPFMLCTSLDSIRIPNGIKTLSGTFISCSSLQYVEIPNSVTSFDSYVFKGCESLSSIDIPSSVISIAQEAFAQCTSLDSITIPNSVTSIGNGAFKDCTALKSVKLSNQLTSLSDNLFQNCTSLASITIPEGVTTIGQYAFTECQRLATVIIPKSVTDIYWQAFYNCMGIEDVFCYPTTMPQANQNVFDNYMYWPLKATLHVPKQLMSQYNATKPWSVFERIIALPDAIDRESGNSATIYYTLNEEGKTASVTSGPEKYESNVTIPSRIFSGGNYYGVTSVENFAFANCTNLSTITLNSSINYVGRFAFADCSKLASVKLPNSITAIEDYTFSGCSNLSEINIPLNVTSIGEGAFSDCQKLQSISIPSKTTFIGMRAFASCKALTAINLSDKLEIIDDNAFEECESLTSLALPNSIAFIGCNAFKGCKSLKEIVFGGYIDEICQDAFIGCTGLKDIYAYSDVPPAADEYTFEESNYDATLHVAATALEVYQSTAPWCYFKHIVTHEEAVYGGIVLQYVYNHDDLTATLVKVTIEKNTHETNLVIPAELQVEGKTYKVTAIDNFALRSLLNGNITSIELPSTLRVLASNTIQVLPQLKTIRIMGDIEKIEPWAFVAYLSNLNGPIENCFLNDFYCFASSVPELSPLALSGGTEGLSRKQSDDDIAEVKLYDITYYLPRYFTFRWNDYNGNYYQATKYQYYLIEHATLHVPANLVDSYKQTFPWNMFGSIVPLTQEDYPAGIAETIKAETMKNVGLYNLQGQRINGLQKGLNIIDGKLIMVK